jgi:hypothetical protein
VERDESLNQEHVGNAFPKQKLAVGCGMEKRTGTEKQQPAESYGWWKCLAGDKNISC